MEINQLVYRLIESGTPVINLSLGEAFFEQQLHDFSVLDWNAGFHYSDSQGIPELRAMIRNLYASRYHAKSLRESQVLVTAGSKIAIFMAITASIRPGETVAIFEPAWVSYTEQVALAGGVSEFIPFDVDLSLPGFVPDGTRLVILCNPNNPAGRLYSPAEMQLIFGECERAGCTLLVDEAYSDFTLSGEFISAFDLGRSDNKAEVIVVNSLSKNLGMSGWRLGYILASEQILERILPLQQNLITCAPTLLQQYVARYLDSIYEETDPQIRKVVAKRNAIQIAGEELGIRFAPGGSTFYLFLDTDSLGLQVPVLDYAIQVLLRRGVSVVPGVAYGSSTSRYLRISVGAESFETIRDGLIVLIAEARNKVSREQLAKELEILGAPNFPWDAW